ncbi:MAG TPA: hypothetical protein VED40_04775 [Azospirillaceae bacterium]|nr:hypothetical protein [Azospirillaceae bacterium]
MPAEPHPPLRPLPGPDDIVADLLEAAPPLGAVFHARAMACPGCVMAPFETVAEAAGAYDLDPDELVAALRAGVRGDLPGGPFPDPHPHA